MAERCPDTILFVEDEEILRSAVAKMLRYNNYSVLEASDGATALDMLRDHEEITLILLDVALPGLSGREVLEEARRIRPGTPVVLTSAFAENTIDSLFAGLNVDHFIMKPYRITALLEVLQQISGIR